MKNLSLINVSRHDSLDPAFLYDKSLGWHVPWTNHPIDETPLGWHVPMDECSLIYVSLPRLSGTNCHNTREFNKRWKFPEQDPCTSPPVHRSPPPLGQPDLTQNNVNVTLCPYLHLQVFYWLFGTNVQIIPRKSGTFWVNMVKHKTMLCLKHVGMHDNQKNETWDI